MLHKARPEHVGRDGAVSGRRRRRPTRLATAVERSSLFASRRQATHQRRVLHQSFRTFAKKRQRTPVEHVVRVNLFRFTTATTTSFRGFFCLNGLFSRDYYYYYYYYYLLRQRAAQHSKYNYINVK